MSALEWSVYNRSNLRQAIHLRSGTLVPTYGRKTPSLGLRTLYPVPAILPSGHCPAHTSCRTWKVRDEEDELLWVLLQVIRVGIPYRQKAHTAYCAMTEDFASSPENINSSDLCTVAPHSWSRMNSGALSILLSRACVVISGTEPREESCWLSSHWLLFQCYE